MLVSVGANTYEIWSDDSIFAAWTSRLEDTTAVGYHLPQERGVLVSNCL